MRTPDGRHCPFYVVDSYRRPQSPERCHLLDGTPDQVRWTSNLCHTCPVPEIKRANQCPHMILHARIGRRGWRFWEGPVMHIHATCRKSQGPVEDPMVGCGACHTPLTFVVAEEGESSDTQENTE